MKFLKLALALVCLTTMGAEYPNTTTSVVLEYTGSTVNLGRFGSVASGDLVEVTPKEARDLLGDSRFAVKKINGASGVTWSAGTPENSVQGWPGWVCWNVTGNTAYFKDSGEGTTTGWVLLSGGGGSSSVYVAGAAVTDPNFDTSQFAVNSTTNVVIKSGASITNAALITPAIGAATGTSLTLSGGVDLSGATDATITRSAAGTIAVEGANVPTTGTGTAGRFAIYTGAATIDRSTNATIDISGNASFTSVTVTGTGESTFILSDGLAAAMTADDTYAGLLRTGINNSGGVTQWDAVYMNGSSQWVLADANGSGTYPCRGIAVATVATGNATTILTRGTIRNDDWNWTPGGTIYLSTTAGALTQTAPSTTADKIQVIGYALDADTMAVEISPDYGTAP